MRRDLAKVEGAPAIGWVGANFWSGAGGPLMWRQFDPERIRRELAVLAGAGLNMTRSFCYWPDFHPEPHTVDRDRLADYRRLLDLHAEAGMSSVPTFIVGHMSGQNWDPTWRRGGSLYSDGWLLARQAYFIRTVVAALADHEAVAGWLVSNEMPIYGGTADHEEVAAWAELMVQAVRAGGGTGPVSLGDGAWGIEVSGVDNGFRLRDLARVVDFVGPHVYPMGDDAVRQHLQAAFSCELSGGFGRPVVLEEFGLSSDFAAPEHAGAYYRQVLHTSLLAGAGGWIAWNNTDFDLEAEDPYCHHPFELHFGITTSGGEPKAPLHELARFAQLLELVQPGRCRRESTETVVVVPSYMEEDRPFTDPAERSAIRDMVLQGYIAAKEADLRPALAREVDGVPPARLVLVPAGRQLTGPGWRRLEELARSGSTVAVSYFSGSTPNQRGPWHPDFEAFFGVRHLLRYGLVEPVEEDPVRYRMESALGDLGAGDELAFRPAGNWSGRSYLPLEPAGAEVLARDGAGRPALTTHRLGRGRVVLSAYPLEYFAASRPGANPEDTWRLYRALAAEAGALPSPNVADPRVMVDGLVDEGGRRLVWLVNLAGEEVTAEVVGLGSAEVAGPGWVEVLLGEPPQAGKITLPPFGVTVLVRPGSAPS
ncbi:MAG: beta-mannosidase [Acidimicrobiales bacterium]